MGGGADSWVGCVSLCCWQQQAGTSAVGAAGLLGPGAPAKQHCHWPFRLACCLCFVAPFQRRVKAGTTWRCRDWCRAACLQAPRSVERLVRPPLAQCMQPSSARTTTCTAWCQASTAQHSTAGRYKFLLLGVGLRFSPVVFSGLPHACRRPFVQGSVPPRDTGQQWRCHPTHTARRGTAVVCSRRLPQRLRPTSLCSCPYLPRRPQRRTRPTS